MPNIRMYILLAVALIFTFSPPAAAEDSASVAPAYMLLLQDDTQRYAGRLQSIMGQVMTEYDVPGMAMAVKFKDGSIFQYAAGAADTARGEPLTVNHLFRIGSASKTITATAALLLYQQGEYDLDQNIESLLPDLGEFAPMAGKGITVRWLLMHLSGLEDYVECDYEEDVFYNLWKDNPLRQWPPELLVEIAVNEGLAAAAGVEFGYSNTNYILLGLLIEKLSGKSYEQFIQENIFDILRLDHTIVPQTSGFPGPFAHGYFERDIDGILYDYSMQNPSGVWAAGNIVSTVGDLLRWLEALISGTLLSPEVREEQFDFRFHDEVYGYGLGVASVNGALGHNGTVFGYQTWMFEYRGVYFVIYNNCLYRQAGIHHISEILFDRIKPVIFAE